MVGWIGMVSPSQASLLVSNGIDSAVRHTSPSVCSNEAMFICQQDMIVWRGLRGALALAPALRLDSTSSDRALVST
jgi:hypothetical protein